MPLYQYMTVSVLLHYFSDLQNLMFSNGISDNHFLTSEVLLMAIIGSVFLWEVYGNLQNSKNRDKISRYISRTKL